MRALRYFPQGGFSPLDLDPEIWFRGDLGITLNGADVSAWANQGSTGAVNDATQATPGNQPAYVSGTYPGVSGVAASNKFLSLTSFAFGTAATIVVVCTAQSTQAGYVWAEGVGNIGLLSNHVATGDLEWFNNPNRQKYVDDPTIGNRYRTVTKQSDGVSLVGRVNGTEAFSVTPTVGLSSISILGAASTAPASPYRGIIHEVVVIKRVISASELASLETYLTTRWA